MAEVLDRIVLSYSPRSVEALGVGALLGIAVALFFAVG
jgi:hypothetical protein